ncbi:MAG TPA: hypothetical protein VGO40_09755 [Longimicrobium sp.]|jgi:hypothetical protein|nr:hypothetical protein [Longimicrobium sp.]
MAGKADLVNSIVDASVVYVPEPADASEWQQASTPADAAPGGSLSLDPLGGGAG